MFDIRITFSRNKDFEQEGVKTVIYTDANGNTVKVEDESLLSHKFPINADLGTLLICSDGLTTSVAWKDIRSISISAPEEL